MNLAEKNILIVGLGYRTGLAAANYLAAKGVRAAVSDSKSVAELAPVIEQLAPGIEVLAGSQNLSILDRGFDLIILSPGVPVKIPLIQEALKRKIEVISEIEFAWRLMRGDSVAITGTDGKTTTTALVHHILSKLGYDARVGGNIGIPMISFADETTEMSVSVLELSSYMLETIDSFKPAVAAILNITPDHLDRYDGMDSYRAAKFRIAMNQNQNDFFIYNQDDPIIVESLGSVRSKKLSFSLKNLSADICYVDKKVFFAGIDSPVLDPSLMKISGLHNVQNAMAAILMVKSLAESRGDIFDIEKTAELIYSFNGLEHRMEHICSFEKRDFINDSKATTVGAVEMALKGFDNNAVVIIGGRGKGDDYSRLIPSLKKGARAVVLIGETKDEFARVFSGLKFIKADDLMDAVVRGFDMSRPGDTILLSPACASFDMFTSYEERGNLFKEAVAEFIRSSIS